jgi:hypothetical protein
MSESDHIYIYICVCVCVCVCARARACACVCVLTTEHRLLVPSVLTLANIDCGFINQFLHPLL